MQKKRKLLLALGIPILMMSLVLGYFAFFYTSTSTWTIAGGSGDPLTITSDLEDTLFLVNETDTITQILEISNSDGQQNMTLGMEIIYTAIDLECPNGETDVDFVFQNYLGEIQDGETFMLNGAGAVFELVGSVDPAIQERVCSGSYEITITMTETEAP